MEWRRMVVLDSGGLADARLFTSNRGQAGFTIREDGGG
jgi:hypothetical protein